MALAGYFGYALYPRFELPAVAGLGLLVLAITAGIAAFFSPCSFPLLLTLLARQTKPAEAGSRAALVRALTFAAALSFGASLMLSITGAGIAVGGSTLFKGVTFASPAGRVLRLVVGSLLILLGLVQLDILTLSLHPVERLSRPLLRAQARLQNQQPLLATSLFGFSYVLAGFG